MTHSEGEYIVLSWEHTPDEYYVRGHVTPEIAEAVMLKHYNELDSLMPKHDNWKHVYARYSMESTWDGNSQVLRTYEESGRGRFKITMCRALE